MAGRIIEPVRDARGATGSRPTVCPFVALLEDRDRRADGPDTRNRCYASPAPRQRELAYQADYCYSDRFSTCAAFLDWAARNAAEPSYPVPGIQAARATEAALLGPASASGPPGGDASVQQLGAGLTDPGAAVDPGTGAAHAAGSLDAYGWVSAAAWSAFPTAPVEPEASPEPETSDDEPIEVDADDLPERDEPTTAPKVPPALPMRRRRRPLEPIRTHGSGEWYYSDPPDRQPLVRRRVSAVPPVALGLIGLLVAALVVVLIPSLLAGDERDPGLASTASSSPGASVRPRVTPRPHDSPVPTEASTPKPPRVRTYRVKAGDSLSAIAERFGVRLELLQCQNLVRDPNLITVGQQLTIPPEGYACAPGWRRATPTPKPQRTPEASASGEAEA